MERNRNLSERPEADSVTFFSILIWFSVLVFWAIMWLTRGEYIELYFFTDHLDTAMDYFNPLSFVTNPDPWSTDANYPACAYLFFKIMLVLVPPNKWGIGRDMRLEMNAQLTYILFLLVCLIVIWEVLRCLAKGGYWKKTLFASSLLFSGPLVWTVERGNILLLVLALTLLFFALYDSEKFALRLLGYVCLAIAAAMKIYPAVFGLMVLWRRRYRETALLVVLGIFFFLAPFFVWNGIDSIMDMLADMKLLFAEQTAGKGFGYNFCMKNLVQLVAALFGVYLADVPSWVAALSAVICLILFVVTKQEWQKLYALVMICIWYPGFSYTYTLVFLFLPIISYFFRTKEQQRGRFHKVYPVLFALTMVPYALPMADGINALIDAEYLPYPTSWGTIVINGILVLLTVLIGVDVLLSREKEKVK